MKKSTFLTTSLAAAILALPTVTMAHEANSFILRVGAVMVEPNEDSSDLSVKTADIGTVENARVGLNSDTQLGINFTYKFTDNLGIGVLGATPFKHDIQSAGLLSDLGLGNLGSTKHLPPTVTLQYFPLSPSSKVQPYVGIGFNYTTFFQEDTSSDLTAAFQTVADLNDVAVTVTGVDLKLDDSFGLAAELGVDYMLTDRLMLNAAIWYADIDTEATLTGKTEEGINVKAKLDVDIDPMVYMVSVGYKF